MIPFFQGNGGSLNLFVTAVNTQVGSMLRPSFDELEDASHGPTR